MEDIVRTGSAHVIDDAVTVHVDPSCPFAWITYRWLTEVERTTSLRLTVRLVSLAVVNEHRELDEWYRTFNDHAWAPARVMAAVAAEHGDDSARRFYEAFGAHFHVQHDTADDVDRRGVALRALADVDLPETVGAAADDERWDTRMRLETRSTLERVGLDVGVPLIEIDGHIASGPVLSAIPTGTAATDLYRAVRTLSAHLGFVRFERARHGDLRTS